VQRWRCSYNNHPSSTSCHDYYTTSYDYYDTTPACHNHARYHQDNSTYDDFCPKSESANNDVG
jgi:hypothetical protein